MVHTRQSRPDSGLGFQVKALEIFVFPPLGLASGTVVPSSQEPPSPQGPIVALYLGTDGNPRGVGFSYERGAPALVRIHSITVMLKVTGLVPWEFEFPLQEALHLPHSLREPARCGGGG